MFGYDMYKYIYRAILQNLINKNKPFKYLQFNTI